LSSPIDQTWKKKAGPTRGGLRTLFLPKGGKEKRAAGIFTRGKGAYHTQVFGKGKGERGKREGIDIHRGVDAGGTRDSFRSRPRGKEKRSLCFRDREKGFPIVYRSPERGREGRRESATSHGREIEIIFFSFAVLKKRGREEKRNCALSPSSLMCSDVRKRGKKSGKIRDYSYIVEQGGRKSPSFIASEGGEGRNALLLQEERGKQGGDFVPISL